MTQGNHESVAHLSVFGTRLTRDRLSDVKENFCQKYIEPVRSMLQERAPVLLDLCRTGFFFQDVKTTEFGRVLYMVGCSIRFMIRSDGGNILRSPKLSTEIERISSLTVEKLQSWGVYDKHVVGLKGNNTWMELGSKVVNCGYDCTVAGVSYASAEAFYNAHKRVEMLHVPQRESVKKRPISTVEGVEGRTKKHRKGQSFQGNLDGIISQIPGAEFLHKDIRGSEACLETQSSHVCVSGSKLIGWKNGTAIGSRVPNRDASVFVKVFDTVENIVSSAVCNLVMSRVGLMHVPMEILVVGIDGAMLKEWTDVATHPDVLEEHGRNFMRHCSSFMNGTRKISMMMIADVFDGDMLSCAIKDNQHDRRFCTDVFTGDLIRIMLVNKFCGFKDLNACNLMLHRKLGRLLRVDAGYATKKEIEDGTNHKTLQTAQKMPVVIFKNVETYVSKFNVEISSFLLHLIQNMANFRRQEVVCRWFDAANIQLLRNGGTDIRKKFVLDIVTFVKAPKKET